MALTLSVKDGGSIRVGEATIRIYVDRDADGLPKRSRRFTVTVDAPPTIPVLRDNLTPEAENALRRRASR